MNTRKICLARKRVDCGQEEGVWSIIHFTADLLHLIMSTTFGRDDFICHRQSLYRSLAPSIYLDPESYDWYASVLSGDRVLAAALASAPFTICEQLPSYMSHTD